MSYDDFRTGLTFSEAQQMLKTHTPGEYRSIRRNAVLGWWREYKLMLWGSEHGGCDED